jgi:hypothetical protein
MEETMMLLIFLVFVVIMTAMIGGFIVRARSAHRGSDAVGLKELEDRIRKAVEQANEPLRRELRDIRSEVEALQPARKRLEGGAVHETPLLAERRAESEEPRRLS